MADGKPGRPRLRPEEKRDRAVNVYLTTAEMLALSHAAAERKASLSAVVAEAAHSGAAPAPDGHRREARRERVSVNLTPAEREAVRLAAKAAGLTVSTYLAECLRQARECP